MERSLGSWVREPGKCPPRSKVEQDLPSLSFSRSTSAPHAPGGPRSSLGFQGARSPGGAGERGAPDPRAAPPGRRPCPAPRFSPSRATPGGSVPTAHAPFPCSPPRHPPKASPQPAGTRSPSLTTPGGEQRAREPRAAAGGASAALTAAPAARAAERRRRWGGTCWLSQPRASPGTAPRPACPPPPGAAEGCGVLPASLAAALAAPRVEPGPGRPRVRWGAGAHPLY